MDGFVLRTALGLTEDGYIKPGYAIVMMIAAFIVIAALSLSKKRY